MYLIIAKNSNYDGYQRGLASIVYIYIYIFFDKKTASTAVKNKNISNKEILEPISRKTK